MWLSGLLKYTHWDGPVKIVWANWDQIFFKAETHDIFGAENGLFK